MSADPFDSLREPVVPIAPSRPFAAELRRRLAERLGVSARPAPPEGSAAARTDVPDIGAYTPAGHTSIVAGLTCARGADAVAWYVEVFDAVLVEPPYMEDDGRLGHAELRVGNTVFSVADEYPDFGLVGPSGTASISLTVYVPDARATYERAIAAGAVSQRPPGEAYGSLRASIWDPFGHRWNIATALAPADEGAAGS